MPVGGARNNSKQTVSVLGTNLPGLATLPARGTQEGTPSATPRSITQCHYPLFLGRSTEEARGPTTGDRRWDRGITAPNPAPQAQGPSSCPGLCCCSLPGPGYPDLPAAALQIPVPPVPSTTRARTEATGPALAKEVVCLALQRELDQRCACRNYGHVLTASIRFSVTLSKGYFLAVRTTQSLFNQCQKIDYFFAHCPYSSPTSQPLAVLAAGPRPLT